MWPAFVWMAFALPPELSWCRAGCATPPAWSCLTPNNRLVDADLYFQCQMVTPQQVQERRARSGPHSQRLISIWANDTAMHALRMGATALPDGSVIAKLKADHGNEFSTERPGADGEGELGVMWKEAAASPHPVDGLFLPWAMTDAARIDPATLADAQAGSPALTSEPRGDSASEARAATAERSGDLGRDAAAAPTATAADLAWWRDARFGMFIHWGLYSEAAGEWNDEPSRGWSEWILNRANIPPQEYRDTLLPRFNPVDFDADSWVRAAKDAGMLWIVVTTKHHDGFCLWDTATTDLDLASTPFGRAGRQPLRELADACARHGVKLGLYFSLMDWSDADYLPRRTWDTRPTDGASFPRFVDRMHTQVAELCDGRFGSVAVLWGDGDWEHSAQDWRSPALADAARRAQPGLLMNDRWSLPGDFATPENKIPDQDIPARPWETCMTLNDTWGYARADAHWKDARTLIRNLVDIVSKGGNYLLNVGPMGTGAFPPATTERLATVGAWMATHGNAIHGAGTAPIARPPWGRVTASANGTRVYAIVFDLPANRVLRLEGIAGVPDRATVMGSPDVSVVASCAGPVLSLTMGQGSVNADAAIVALEWTHAVPFVGSPVLTGGDDVFLHETDIAFAPNAAGTIHITLDGSDPTPASRAYTVPINVQATTIVRAQTFVDGVPAGAPIERTFRKAQWIPGSDDEPTSHGLVWTLLPGKRQTVLRDREWPSEGTTRGTMSTVGLPSPHPDDAFGLRLDGFVLVEHAGIHAFVLESDDGSVLEIDGQTIVDHDGPHAASRATGKAALDIGWHEITLRYFEDTGSESLALLWHTPSDAADTPPQAIAPTLLRHNER